MKDYEPFGALIFVPRQVQVSSSKENYRDTGIEEDDLS